MGEDSRRVAIWLAGVLGLCCISVPALLGGAAVVGGTAGATAVSTGVRSLRVLAATVLVTVVTLVPVYLAWRWHAG
jgi:hypothetical protein